MKYIVVIQFIIILAAFGIGHLVVRRSAHRATSGNWLQGIWLMACLTLVMLSMLAFYHPRASAAEEQRRVTGLAAATSTWFTNASSIPFVTNADGYIEIFGRDVSRLVDILSRPRASSGVVYLAAVPETLLTPTGQGRTLHVIIDAMGKGYCDLGPFGGVRSNKVVVISSTHVIGESR